MRKAMEAVVDEVNAAGGVLGRKIELVSEDDQTNPEAAVRAARKLIDVDKVAAIMGTWASAVTTAVAPLCWESKTFLTTVSGSDTITQLPHQGYLIRTQPNTKLQIGKLGEFLISLKVKRVFVLAAQTPFALPSQKRLTEILPKGGGEVVGARHLRQGQDDVPLGDRPGAAGQAGHDLSQRLHAGHHGGAEGALQGRLHRGQGRPGLRGEPEAARLDARRGDATAPTPPRRSPAVDSAGYKRLAKFLGASDLDPYSCQCHDHISLVALAIAKAKGEATGTAVRTTCARSRRAAGVKVDSAVDGLKLLAQGKEINYEGASGPCDFTDIGDILDCQFRYEQAEGRQVQAS